LEQNLMTCLGMIIISNEVGVVYELPSPAALSLSINFKNTTNYNSESKEIIMQIKHCNMF